MVASAPDGSFPVEVATLSNGRRIAVRQIHADDKARMVAAFERLSPESRYRRFFGPVQRLSDEDLVYLTEVDHHNHEAMVALDETQEMGLGVARYVRSVDDSSTAEVAVTVVDDWQQMGIGTLLLSRLADRAREEGITRFSALVQADNRLMLDLVRGLGEVRSRSEGTELVLAIDLPAEPERRRRFSTVLREAGQLRLTLTRRPGDAALS